MRLSTLTLTVVACLIVDAAQAHAHLQKSSPADGSTLSTAPAAVELTFSEAARLTALWIEQDRQPRRTIRELPAAWDRTLRVALPALAPGVYSLVWRAVAADGHVSSGSVRFTISPAAR